MNNIPDKLYRYVPIDDKLKKSFEENYIWFSDPNDFNDPYDLNISYDYDCDENIFKEYLLNEASNKKSFNFSIEKRLDEYRTNPKSFFDSIKMEEFKLISENYGICCFSEYYDSILMWSHYADKHKGICLCFNPYQDEMTFEFPIRVDYPEIYPRINYFQNKRNKKISSIQFCLATKSKDWKYEQEIRIIKEKGYSEQFREKIKFNKSSLIEVIFGYKTEPKVESEVVAEINKLGYKVEFSKMKLKEYEFGLKKEKKHIG